MIWEMAMAPDDNFNVFAYFVYDDNVACVSYLIYNALQTV